MIQFDSQDKTMLTRLANRNVAPPMTQFSQWKQNPDTRARNCIESKEKRFERNTFFFFRENVFTLIAKNIYLRVFFKVFWERFFFSEIILKISNLYFFMFYEKILSLKTFFSLKYYYFLLLVWKLFLSNILFSLMKCFFAISVITFSLKLFFFSQIFYFLACNKDTILAPYALFKLFHTERLCKYYINKTLHIIWWLSL